MRAWILPLILLLEIGLFAPICGVQFDSFERFVETSQYFASDIFRQASPLLVLSVGMTFILMTGGIDLSVGSMVALIACVMSTFEGSMSFWWQAVPIGLLLGLGLGAFNGTLIAKLDVPPIITTLGTLFFFRGLCNVVMKGSENAPFYDVPGYEFLQTVPGLLMVVLPVCFGGSYAFYHSRWRRELLMIGGNRIAARYAGIPVGWRLLQTYTLMGFLAFLAALFLTSSNSSVNASAFSGMELQVIVAVVLGGTRVEGGMGTVINSLLGVLMISLLDEGLRGAGGMNLELPFEISHLRFLLLGMLLVGGVWLNRK